MSVGFCTAKLAVAPFELALCCPVLSSGLHFVEGFLPVFVFLTSPVSTADLTQSLCGLLSTAMTFTVRLCIYDVW